MKEAPPRDPIRVVPVARGSLRAGYRGLVRVEYRDGPDWEPLGPCEHRHRLTRTARACGSRRWEAFILARTDGRR